MRFGVLSFQRGIVWAGLIAAISAHVVLAGDPPAARKLPDKPDAGYAARFDAALAKIGQISPEEFASRYPAPDYLSKLSWDPTTAKFWDEFIREPGQPKKPPEPWFDFRPNPEEIAKFRENGFVVSERLAAQSFGEIFYRIYSRDLPVFISADAILHAWHRSFDAMLDEWEASYFGPALNEMLGAMSAAVTSADKDYGRGPLSESLRDADYFLAVAQSLLTGITSNGKLGQPQRVANTLNAIADEQMQTLMLFGREREMDFSQFKPRGRYERTADLKRYFRAMMWCGRTDLRIAGGRDQTGELSSPRELGSALVLHDLLRRSGKFDLWTQFDSMMQTMIGRTDSATFAHLDAFLQEAKISSAAGIRSDQELEKLQGRILNGQFGLQAIRSDIYFSPEGSQQVQLPRSFTMLGQRFAIDSWAMSKFVYDDIQWDGRKVIRRIPSGLDAAFAVFGNNQVAPQIVERITNNGRAFRDGLPYQHNLAAARTVIDQRSKSEWTGTVYDGWLAALRELSQPTTDARFPEAMRTRAWAMKTLNTQLASWTQLRHDTVLYVKQSYSSTALCYYPAGFVEPVPAFWDAMERMTTRWANVLGSTSFPDYKVEPPTPINKVRPREQWPTVQKLAERHRMFLERFSRRMALLKSIANKQMDQRELTAEETLMLKEVVHRPSGGSGYTQYTGWYPSLFYKQSTDCAKWDAVVADVHTDPPDLMVGDPGCVLHQGVGNVETMIIAIDNGKDRVVYAGPVLSHYEFERPNAQRMTDSSWRQAIIDGKLPPRPEWTREYVVPGSSAKVIDYKKKAVDD